MSENLEKFKICEYIPQNIKNEINILYVFRQYKNNDFTNNLLFVTNDDNVYVLGDNTYGCLGLGHNCDVNEIQIITELCQKKINQFFNGNGFVLALTDRSDIFSWGKNDLAQLGRGFSCEPEVFSKPERMNYFNNKKIVQVSCGIAHCLVLTSVGVVYGWGHNFYGQLGTGNENIIKLPKNLNNYFEQKIQSIYCYNNLSFAILTNGNVYSWGDNSNRQLGYDLKTKDNQLTPKLVDINNIFMIRSNEYNTYFLTKDGLLYFCGQLNSKEFQKIPKQLEFGIKITGIQSIMNLLEDSDKITALGQECLLILCRDKFEKTSYNNFFDYYSKEYEITYNTMNTINNKSQMVPEHLPESLFDLALNKGDEIIGNKVDPSHSMRQIYAHTQTSYYLPGSIKFGQVDFDGNCFFDSFRQNLEQQKLLTTSVMQLRQICSNYAKNKPAQWFIEAIANSQDNFLIRRSETPSSYSGNILSNVRCGDPDVEGRILCRHYGIKIHIMEKCDITENMWVNQIIDANGSSSFESINNEDKDIVHIAKLGHGHFLPVLCSKIKIAKEQNKVKDQIQFDILQPVKLFTGRERELILLHSYLQSDIRQAVISQTISITGLGGVGKSELARKYALDYQDDYDGNVIWIDAEKDDSIKGSFIKLARTLKISVSEIRPSMIQNSSKTLQKKRKAKPVAKHISKSARYNIEYDKEPKMRTGLVDSDVEIDYFIEIEQEEIVYERDIKDIVSDVYAKFKSKKCLFIFDNAENSELVNQFLPSSSVPTHLMSQMPFILITSRYRDWDLGENGTIEVVELNEFTQAEAEEFIGKMIDISEESPERIEEFSKLLQYLPLALNQAAATIREKNKIKQIIGEKYGIGQYVKEYKIEGKKLEFLGYKPKICRYTETVYTTWKVTLNNIMQSGKVGKLAIEIIEIMCYLLPDNIPAQRIFSNLGGENLAEALNLLHKFSMIYAKNGSASIHRLTQEVIRLDQKVNEEEILKKGCKLIENDDGFEEVIVKHVQSLWMYTSNYDSLVNEFKKLPEIIMWGLQNNLKIEEAYDFGLEASEVLKNKLGLNHLVTLSILNSLAVIATENGKFEQALKLHQDVLDKRLELFGEDDNENLSIRVEIAWVFVLEGKYYKAYQIYRDVFEKRKQDLAPDHMNTLLTMDNMAFAQNKLGQYDNAIEAHSYVYEKIKETYPRIALKTKFNLALALRDKGDYDEAMKLLLELHEEEVNELGQDDPETLNTKHNIGIIQLCKIDYSNSLITLTDVYKRRKNVLGEVNPHTLMVRRNICLAQYCNGDSTNAIIDLVKITKDVGKYLGSSHLYYLEFGMEIKLLQTISKIPKFFFKQNSLQVLHLIPLLPRMSFLIPFMSLFGELMADLSQLSLWKNPLKVGSLFMSIIPELMNIAIELIRNKDLSLEFLPLNITILIQKYIIQQLTEQNRYDKALDVLSSSFDICLDTFGPEHIYTMSVKSNLDEIRNKSLQ